MKIIFLSLMYSDRQLEEAFRYSKRSVQMAPHTFQQNLCRGLRAIEDVSVEMISCAPVGSFPMNYRKWKIPSEIQSGQTAVGFINFSKIKYEVQVPKLIAAVRRQIRADEPTVLLIYSLHMPFMRVAYRLKKEFPDLRVCLIQTDSVPGVDDMEKHMTRETKQRGKALLQLSDCCDGFVILTKYLAAPLQIGTRPYTVLEGIAAASSAAALPTVEHSNVGTVKTFLYTGSLNTAYGIRELTEAFLLNEHKLIICGDGDYKQKLINLVQNNPKENIEFKGFLKPDELLSLRSQADFLINPRQPSGTYTKYSFPSKTMEYLVSGVPTVMYKLEGIPDEYDDYLNYLTEHSPQGIDKELKALCASDYSLYLQKADAGKRFVLENKNEYVQADRVYQLLKQLF